VTKNTFKNQLVAEFTNELGTLLSMRIFQYISKYKEGDESKFLNEFIICPYDNDNDYDRDYIRYPAMARRHFEEKLNVEFGYFELNGIKLDSNKNLEYYLTWFTEDFQDEYIGFGLNGKQITFDKQETIDFFETLTNDFWRKMIKDARKKISFGTLKNT